MGQKWSAVAVVWRSSFFPMCPEQTLDLVQHIQQVKAQLYFFSETEHWNKFKMCLQGKKRNIDTLSMYNKET